jgi:glutamate/tyrosine decarboxylase-like PLP-dependent enzyme
MSIQEHSTRLPRFARVPWKPARGYTWTAHLVYGPPLRHLTEGFEQADSIATDAHKWPNVGYDCGIVLVREPRHLRAAMSVSVAYITPGEGREPHHHTPEMSRRARGIELWAALRSLGREEWPN